MQRWYLGGALVATLTIACAASPGERPARLPVGTTVVLNQPLTVPAGQARVFLQGGRVIERVRLRQYYPHCDFEIRQVSDGSAGIAPDRFTVTAVTEGEEPVVMRQTLHYAGLRLSDMQQDGVSMVSRYLHHWLHSPRQPQVLRLTCHGGFDFPGRAQLPTVAEIRYALGEVVTLSAPASPER